jgi:hypothetical protein
MASELDQWTISELQKTGNIKVKVNKKIWWNILGSTSHFLDFGIVAWYFVAFVNIYEGLLISLTNVLANNRTGNASERANERK